ncbi:MAG: NAD-dependent epimerase/dehydratase family protein [Fimbriimonadaceae bacterium]|nr:NAD-dependent epimerase/dehydratase family protein [Fimbriimonadaceae bacterium]
MNVQKALVTGGAGFIGSHLVTALHENGIEVTIIDDMSNGLESNLSHLDPKIRIIRSSILEPDALSLAAEGSDVIFHLAAVSNVAQTLEEPILAHEVNASGTLAILEQARKNHAHIVFSSSAAIYGDSTQIPIQESATCNPISLYGSQKLLGEHYVRNYCDLYNLSGVCLRYFNVYGPRQRSDSPYSGVISKFINSAINDEPIFLHGGGNQKRDFVSVHDVVRANILAMTARIKGDGINVCTGSSTSVSELAQKIIGISGSKSELRTSPAREGDIINSEGSPAQAKNIIRFERKIGLDDGLKELIQSIQM